MCQRRAVPRARDHPRDVFPNQPQAGACHFLPPFYAFLLLGAGLEANQHHRQRHGQALLPPSGVSVGMTRRWPTNELRAP